MNNLELDFAVNRERKDISALVLELLQRDLTKRLSTTITLYALGSGGGHFKYQGWVGDGHLKAHELADRIAAYISRHVNGRGGIAYRGATVSCV
jgi:hypothetical protein